MPSEQHVMGLFTDENQAVSAIEDLKHSSYKLQKIHSPFPSHKILGVLGLKKSKVGYFTLTGGILGFVTGFALAIYTATQWNLVISGKPVVALVPFVIVGFEFTVLFAIFGNVIGLLTQMRLPNLTQPEHYDPRCTGRHFGVLASCDSGQQEALASFFRQKGGEVRLFDH